MIKQWECTADYIINQLRLTRPFSIENEDQVGTVKRYHDSVNENFEGYYARKQQPFSWNDKTAILGKDNLELISSNSSFDVSFNSSLPIEYQNTQELIDRY